MSLLRGIQEAAVDSKTDLADVLRKCKVLSFRLKSPELKAWIDDELNGYKTRESLPDYRVLRVMTLGHFVGSAGAEAKCPNTSCCGP